MKELDTAVLLAAFFGSILLGNLVGDQATIKDCATKGTAKMLGGGTVSCTVIQEKRT
jgi:hypothetical protein